MDAQFVTYAAGFAAAAHDQQKRKYTGEPYVAHPLAVLDILAPYVRFDTAMATAAVLHDVLEDTSVSADTILVQFGPDVLALVEALTDRQTAAAGNRAFRKDAYLKKVVAGGPRAQTIKVADLMDNTKSIVEHDPNFAKVYLPEKRLALRAMTMAHPRLRRSAFRALRLAEQQLNQA